MPHKAHRTLLRCVVLLAVLAAIQTSALAMQHVEFRREGKTRSISGRLIVKAADGGLMVEATDGLLWAIQPDEIVKESSDEAPFKPLGKKELAKKLLEELPPGFAVHNTARYIVCYNTSPAYAQWCGALLERLHAGFRNYWTRRDLKLEETELPLVAIIFRDQESFAAYAKPELGESTKSIIGYYSMHTNRVAMYDLTGVAAIRGKGSAGTSAQINALLSRPEAERTVATIIHEATHQIAYNCGLQRRWADVPLWLNEGIAMFFESPDLESKSGWRGIGEVNRYQLSQFAAYAGSRPKDSLATLISDNKRYQDGKTVTGAYAESWALTYFLIRSKPKQFSEYLKLHSDKKPLQEEEPGARIAEFKKCFGENLDKLDAEFMQWMRRQK